MFRIGSLVAMIALLISESSFADELVSCTNIKGAANSTTISYSIRSTDSRRLGSDIQLKTRGTTTVVSSLSVAQYLARPEVLVVVIDNASENRILEFQAFPFFKRSGKFEGTITEISNGSLLSRTFLRCTMTHQ